MIRGSSLQGGVKKPRGKNEPVKHAVPKEELTMDGQLQLNGKVLTMDQTLEEQGVKELVGGKRVVIGMDSNGGRFMHVFLLLRK